MAGAGRSDRELISLLFLELIIERIGAVRRAGICWIDEQVCACGVVAGNDSGTSGGTSAKDEEGGAGARENESDCGHSANSRANNHTSFRVTLRETDLKSVIIDTLSLDTGHVVTNGRDGVADVGSVSAVGIVFFSHSRTRSIRTLVEVTEARVDISSQRSVTRDLWAKIQNHTSALAVTFRDLAFAIDSLERATRVHRVIHNGTATVDAEIVATCLRGLTSLPVRVGIDTPSGTATVGVTERISARVVVGSAVTRDVGSRFAGAVETAARALGNRATGNVWSRHTLEERVRKR